MTPRQGLIAAALSGLAAAAGQAPLSLWWLALAGFAGLIWVIAQSAVPARQAWAAGAASFAASLSWIVNPFFVDPVRHGWMAPFALVLMAGGLAFFWALAGWIAGRWPVGPHRALAFAVALAGAEALRGVVFTGFPWALPGHIWIDTAIAQWAAVTGANGLTLATLLVAALPATGGWWAVPALAVVTSGALILAEARLRQEPPPDRPVSLRLVQPNAEQHLKWDPDQARMLFDRQLQLTAEGPPVDLTIWPETSVPYLIDAYPEVATLMSSAARGGLVAAGVQRVEGPRGWNSLAIIAPGGDLIATYDKWHLVPFGEYIPFGDRLYDWFGLAAFAAQVGGGYSAGPGPQVLDLGPAIGTVAPLICYEAIFPRHLNALPSRPDWILQITNDAWFGIRTGPWQHAGLARLRAIEQGLPLVRVANTGLTVMWDAHGRQVAALPFGAAGQLTLPVIPGALPATVHARLGEGPFLLCLVMLALGLGVMRLSRRP